MGSLTDNLLKLTEFPFSYSFLGIIALRFGEGLNPVDLSSLGPLLVLMGFVATTLAITDPVGVVQKFLLKGFKLPKSLKSKYQKSLTTPIKEFWSLRVFGIEMKEVFKPGSVSESSEIAKRSDPALACLGSKSLSRWLDEGVKKEIRHEMLDKLEKDGPFAIMDDDDDIEEIKTRAVSLRDQTLNTPWIVREIDKITSMVYFIIVIVTFIIFLVTGYDFIDRFAAAFRAGSLIGVGDNYTSSRDLIQIERLLESANGKSFENAAVTGLGLEEINSTLSLLDRKETANEELIVEPLQNAHAYLRNATELLQNATRLNQNASQLTEENKIAAENMRAEAAIMRAAAKNMTAAAKPEISNADTEVDNQIAALRIASQSIFIGLMIFSLGALAGILFIVYKRRRELKHNAIMVFKFLVVREAYTVARRTIKVQSETFKEDVDAVEQYLNNGNWTLAWITVDEIISDFDNLYYEKLKAIRLE